MEVLITFIIMLILFFLGFPIAFSMLLSALFYIGVLNSQLPMFIIPQRMMYAIDSFPLMAVPFFILAAELMNQGGITRRLFSFARAMVGHIPGGLAHVNILASIIMSGMSGSAVADASGLGKIEIEAMKQSGFDDGFSAAVTASSSIIGPIIPPSIPVIIYAVAASTSAGKLLLAGVIPGLLMGIGLMLVSYIIALRKNYPREEKSSLKEKVTSFGEAFFPMMLPVILVYGFAGGIFTTTEASVVATFYALLLSTIYLIVDQRKQKAKSFKRNLLKKYVRTFIDAGCTASVVLAIISAAGVLGAIILREQLPQRLSAFIIGATVNPYVVLLFLNILFLVLGCFMEALSIILMVTPLLVPTLIQIGISPVHFGMIIILNLMIGMITPPFGVSMYITCDIAKINIRQFSKSVAHFLGVLIFVLLLITYVPFFTLWLPDLLIK
jgi:tripartite ATP-independent transporter DctM subunit